MEVRLTDGVSLNVRKRVYGAPKFRPSRTYNHISGDSLERQQILSLAMKMTEIIGCKFVGIFL